MKNPWQTLTSKEVYHNNWIQVEEHQVINPSGGRGIYGKVHFKNKAVGIIPIDDENNTWLVGQWRYPLQAWSWEIPEGGSPLAANVLASAQRELKEETGIIAQKWTELMRMHLSNSVSDEEAIIFIAEGLTMGTNAKEETEADMVIRKTPFGEALKMVLRGEITDSMSVAGILKLAMGKGLYA